jgi:hypothetical protein
MNYTLLLLILTGITAIGIGFYFLLGDPHRSAYDTTTIPPPHETMALLDTLKYALTDPEYTPVTQLSPEERGLLAALEHAITDQYRVFCKIRLDELVSMPTAHPPSQQTEPVTDKQSLPVDYLICTYPDLKPVGVVMQKYPTAVTTQRVFFSQLLISSNIPVTTFPFKSEFTQPEVKTKLLEAFPVSLISSVPIPHGSPSTPPPKTSNLLLVQQAAQAEQKCPQCSAPMIKRQVSKGPHAGRFFWACSNYPTCKQLLAVNKTATDDDSRSCLACGAPMAQLRVNKGPHAGKFFWACSTYPTCTYMTTH